MAAAMLTSVTRPAFPVQSLGSSLRAAKARSVLVVRAAQVSAPRADAAMAQLQLRYRDWIRNGYGCIAPQPVRACRCCQCLPCTGEIPRMDKCLIYYFCALQNDQVIQPINGDPFIGASPHCLKLTAHASSKLQQLL